MTGKSRKKKAPGFGGGYVGKILRVDLSKGDLSEEDLPGADILKKYIGCWGLG